MLAISSGVSEFGSCLSETYCNVVVRLFSPTFFAAIAAVFFCLCGEVHADDAPAGRPARPAQCFLEVNGVHYLGGDCLFTPLDRDGSFQITSAKHIKVLVKVTAPGHADLSWSGPDGGDSTAVILGDAVSSDTGCWSSFDYTSIPPEKIAVCAWDKNERLFLGPTPAEQSASSLSWGERDGMYAQILSSAGLDTENAVVTATKDRGGAINWCRVNYDYSVGCIENTLKGSGLAPAKVTLHANCKTRKFTDFWGRNLEALKDDILDLDTNAKIGPSAAGGATVAETAYAALCPKEAE